ncbi:AAA family ATPase [Flectobacillus sp. BAB-3569]|uniref:AAA family ATPase n=1 Tax=Flectobacillus sp. BAB-3569 TaxID=1509483 RepID=UPI000BA4C6A2|nr:AAA family ATPase [Flectobacillus sp. BAB-3569]PAC32175.1 chromosome segregation protein SMC [Flectobacillus sp. BAB-3569]
MKIKSVQLKNFKRFTDLRIENIPEETKLVLLIGTNGSGKSSVFDGFRYSTFVANSSTKNDGLLIKPETIKEYYRKQVDEPTECTINLYHNKEIHRLEQYQLESLNPDAFDLRKKFIGRSSSRIIPKIINQADLAEINKDADAPALYIDNDTRFINDVFSYIQQINKALREPAFRGESANTFEIFQEFIAPLNSSLSTIFGDDTALSLKIVEFEDVSPSKPAKLIFQKGNSKINYDLLSHGEKQVIILLLNFIVRKKQYEDAIIYIDEMDCHLNTSLQETLLKEIVEKWIPDSSQLWTASHALGFIDYARKTDNAVILDFDSLNFDAPQTIVPQSKEVLDVYDLAIPKSILSQLFSDKKIVFCENKNDEYYNLMGIDKTLFVGVKDSRDVFLHIKNDKTKFSLRDRDFLSDSEIQMIQEKYPNHRILKYYDFENYLYHPDNIAELGLVNFDKDEYQAEILKQKQDKIHYILPKVESARKTYEEFKIDFKPESTDKIVDDFMSDEFERFYKFFDMKEQFNRSFLSPFNIKIKDLSSTQWFKEQIEKITQ